MFVINSSKSSAILGGGSLAFIEDELLVGSLLCLAWIDLLLLVEHQHVLLLVRVKVDVVLEPLHDAGFVAEENDCREVLVEGFLPLLLRSWSCLSETTVDGLVINHDFELVGATARGLAVIPESHGADSSRLIKYHRDEVRLTLVRVLLRGIGSRMRSSEFERCKPHVSIVKHLVLSVEQLIKGSHVALHSWHSIDSCWINHDLFLSIDCNDVSKLIIKLDSVETNVIVVSMGRIQVDSEIESNRHAYGLVLLQ